MTAFTGHVRAHRHRAVRRPTRAAPRPRGRRRAILLVATVAVLNVDRRGDGAVGVVGGVAHRLRIAVVLLPRAS